MSDTEHDESAAGHDDAALARLPGSGRVRDLEGAVPLHVVVWLEQHPTAALATALSAGAPAVRWHYRVSEGVEVVLRGPRVEVVDPRTGARLGSARVQGARAAADFDALPQAMEPPPFTLPELPYPSACRFACDLDGRVARFLPSGTAVASAGLAPRASAYDHGGGALPEAGEMSRALAVGHERVAHPLRVFACRVRELLAALSLPSVTGSARAHAWFEGDAVLVWPVGSSELFSSAVAALHARKSCRGCSSLDPRDALARGTYRYGRSTRGADAGAGVFLREESPVEPLTVATAAALLGRTPAELAATQLNVRFAEAQRVDVGRVRFAM